MAAAGLSVFDMLKIGVGPSSSHTLGPWRAARRFLERVEAEGPLGEVTRLRVELFGSLAKTGAGHGTDIGIYQGLRGADPETCELAGLSEVAHDVTRERSLHLLGRHRLPFDPGTDFVVHRDQTLPEHPNGVTFTAWRGTQTISATYFSVGGGFVVERSELAGGGATAETKMADAVGQPFPYTNAAELEAHCRESGLTIADLALANEVAVRSPAEVHEGLARLWQTMAASMARGCTSTHALLPGALGVHRRAPRLYASLMGDDQQGDPGGEKWLNRVASRSYSMEEMLRWISCVALAVNEENASFGRVVTAPTNGSAGVIPAVLMYYWCSRRPGPEAMGRFLLTAGVIGALFKMGATISAAMGGCQAEIGVSSAMAAGALCEALGGSVGQVLMAAEIAMEHHLGLTCDPVGGLVQIPCIERNTMGAVKAITACQLALSGSPQTAKVSLDSAIETLWRTALDMNEKYKETALGGLAISVPVSLAEC